MKLNDCWTESDQAAIIKTLTVMINGQKAFGKTVSLTDTYEYYKMKLDGRFPADRVIAALEFYTDTRNDVPAPADLITLMTPNVPRISTAEFIHAKEQHALENYPAYGYWGQIIKQYELENADARVKAVAPLEERRSISGDNWKKLT